MSVSVDFSFLRPNQFLNLVYWKCSFLKIKSFMSKEILYGFLGIGIGAVLMGLITLKSPASQTESINVMSMDKTQDSRKEEGAMSMSDMTEALQDTSGDAFDQAFIEMMIEHHQGAIDMANLIPTRAQHDELRKLGEDIITAQTKEINEMRQWLMDWGYANNTTMPMMGH